MITTDAPALSLSLALALPTLRLEYIGGAQAEVYALTLSGVALPFSSITCRRNTGGMALTVALPIASATLRDVVSANEGGTVEVRRGSRLPDGSLQLDTLWTATLDTWKWRTGVTFGEITLNASAPTVAGTSRVRALREASYVGSDRGTRRIRCAIDTYLSPGDEALLGGGQSVVVTGITYSVHRGQGVMEIQGI